MRVSGARLAAGSPDTGCAGADLLLDASAANTHTRSPGWLKDGTARQKEDSEAPVLFQQALRTGSPKTQAGRESGVQPRSQATGAGARSPDPSRDRGF